MTQQQKRFLKNFGTYTCQTFSESNSGNVGGSSVNKSKSMNISQRSLLTPDEVLRINRPYLLVMYSGHNPAMTIAPDLHKWKFNRMLSLGNPEFCTKVRIIREAAREERADTNIPIWNIDQQIQEEIERKKAEEAERRKQELVNRRMGGFKTP